MITIMGASGRVGGAVLEVVSQAGQPVRALSRTPPAETRPNVEWRAVEALDSAALAAAFAGSDAVFVMNPIAAGAEDVTREAAQLSAAVAQALRQASISYAVALSSQGAHLAGGTGIVTTLHDFEMALRDTPTRIAVLRPAMFMESWIPLAGIGADTGAMPAFLAPLDRAIEAVSAIDVGRAAGQLLLSPRPGIFNLTGPRRYSERDAAAILSRHAGRAISADPVPEQEIAAFHMAAGLGASFSEGIAGMYMALNRDGIPFSGDGAQSLSCETPLETVLAPVVAQPV